ncbi:hypothetical protein DPMN_089807 [Dreissena polymorpha]|uniref:Uncharacterized protein n=1 Tax=Dreissena polymorpha TaxID=45954 RepID=A0A9D4QXN3_DREPO|nr:hypothetical protein DPMN_089807 [Dreissena polymorpha]
MVLFETTSRIGMFLSANDISSLTGFHLIPSILTTSSVSSTFSFFARDLSVSLLEVYERRFIHALDIKRRDSVK